MKAANSHMLFQTVFRVAKRTGLASPEKEPEGYQGIETMIIHLVLRTASYDWAWKVWENAVKIVTLTFLESKIAREPDSYFISEDALMKQTDQRDLQNSIEIFLGSVPRNTKDQDNKK